MCKYIIAIYFVFITVSYAQWQQTVGPLGGNCYALAKNNTKIFAATNYGVYVSVDDGISWQQSSLNNRVIYCVAANDSVIFAGTQLQGIYRSSDNGISWQQVPVLNYGACYSLLVTNAYVYASVNGLKRSSDNGITWISLTGVGGYQLASKQDSVIYSASTWGLFRSTDYGNNWLQILYVNPEVNSVAVKDNNIFAGAFNKIYISADDGNTWQQQNISGTINTITIQPTIVFVGSTSGVFTSINNGQNWSITSLSKVTNSLLCDENSSYAATNYFGIYKSINNGQNWTQMPLKNQVASALLAKDSILLAGITNIGIYRSADNGNSWEISNSSPYQLTNVSQFLYVNSEVFVAVKSYGLFKSIDTGRNWIRMPLYRDGLALLSKDSLLFAGTDQGIYISNNNGNNWISIFTGQNNSFPCLSQSAGTIFAGTNGSGVYLSTNNGQNWTQKVLNSSSVWSLSALYPYVFAGTENSIYRSSDNGLNWEQVLYAGNKTNSMFALPNGYVFAGIDSIGFYVSSNWGMSWLQKNDGFGTHGIKSLSIDGNYIYAGSDGYSVWKRLLSEIVALNLSSSIIPNSFNLRQNYPNPFNPATEIKYDLPTAANVTIKIYNTLGEEVKTLIGNEFKNAGYYSVSFDGSALASGVYFYTITAGEFRDSKKMVLIK
jgi:photosystem II stability/assembly factor-like uncharacterized protein